MIKSKNLSSLKLLFSRKYVFIPFRIKAIDYQFKYKGEDRLPFPVMVCIFILLQGAILTSGIAYAATSPEIQYVKVDGTTVSAGGEITVNFNLGETFLFEINVKNNGDDSPGPYNNITVCFSQFTYSSDKSRVSLYDRSTDLNYTEFFGSEASGGDGYADWVMVESQSTDEWDGNDIWPIGSESEWLKVTLTPKYYGSFYIYYRAAMSNQQSWSSSWTYEPASGWYSDCLGFRAYRIKVNVQAPPQLTATIYNAWWSNEVDNDNDGYVSSARLNWDPDVSGGSGSLNVYEKIYWKLKNSSSWNLITTTSSHSITNTTSSDSQYHNYDGGSHNEYDWKIEIYRSSVGLLDYTRSPSNDGDLNDYKMETDSEDVPMPTITGFSPSKASAGTDSRVTITGSNFGSSRGSGKVEFWYGRNEPGDPLRIEAPIISWGDSSIICEVPVATLNNYLASACSGPITITNDSGDIVTSNSNFKVAFSYDGAKWTDFLGPSTVSYRINENTSDCIGEGAAVIAAANSWNNVGADFTFKYVGSTSNTTADSNGSNDILWDNNEEGVAYTSRYTWYSLPLGIILECDMVFRDLNSNWSSSSPGPFELDIQSVALHEFGHFLTLRDLYGDIRDGEYDTGKVMYGRIAPGVIKRNLHQDDIEGIQWIYGATSTNATIWNAWWSNEIDEDGDSYVRSANLNWDPDVSGGNTTLTVYEKIYWKLKSSSSWNLISTTSAHTISGTRHLHNLKT